jgi:hypothetical protein
MILLEQVPLFPPSVCLRPKEISKKPSNENLIVSGILCKLSRRRRQNIQICSAITVLPLFVRLPFHSSNYKQFTPLIIGRKAKKNAFLLCKQNVKMLVMGMNKREFDELEMQTREFRGKLKSQTKDFNAWARKERVTGGLIG